MSLNLPHKKKIEEEVPNPVVARFSLGPNRGVNLQGGVNSWNAQSYKIANQTNPRPAQNNNPWKNNASSVALLSLPASTSTDNDSHYEPGFQKSYTQYLKPFTDKVADFNDWVYENDPDRNDFDFGDFNDYLRLGVSLIPNSLQALVESPRRFHAAATGKRWDEETDTVEDLSVGQRFGEAGSGALDSFGLALGGSGKFIKAGAKTALGLIKPGVDKVVTSPTVKNAITKTLNSTLTKNAANFAKESGIEGVEEAAQVFTEDLADDGKLQATKEDYLKAAGVGTIGGAMFQGGALALDAVRPGKTGKPTVTSTSANKGNENASEWVKDQQVLDMMADQQVSVKQEDTPYGAAYNPTTKEILLKDESYATPDYLFQELGHDLWSHYLTPEDKAAFAESRDIGYQQSEGRPGYTLDDRIAEDFSVYVARALNGRLNEVPVEYQKIVADYTKTVVEEAKTDQRKLKQLDDAVGQQNTLLDLEQITNSRIGETLTQYRERGFGSQEKAFELDENSSYAQYRSLLDEVGESKLKDQSRQASIDTSDGMSKSQQLRELEEQKNEIPATRKARNFVAQNLANPLSVAQRMDDQYFAYLRETGQLLPKQKHLDSKESLTRAITNSANPTRIRNAMLNIQHATTDPNNSMSVKQVIAKVGQSDTTKYNEFMEYRLFMDQLWRIANGEANTLPDSPKFMMNRVAEIAAENPEFADYHAVIRAHDLSLVRMREEAGILEPGTTEKLAQNPYYTRRDTAKPEDIAGMKISGGVRTGIKGIHNRGDFNEAPSAHLNSVLLETNRAITDVNNERIGSILKNRMDANVPGMENFTQQIDSKVLRLHKGLAEESKMLGKNVKEYRDLRDKLKAEKRKVTKKQKSAAKESSKAQTRKVKLDKKAIAELQERTKKREDAIVRHVDRLIELAKRDPEQVLSDIANEKITRQQKIDIGESLSREFLAPKVTKATTDAQAAASKKAKASKRLPRKLQKDVDALDGMVQSARQMVEDARSEQSSTYQAYLDTTQRAESGIKNAYYGDKGTLGVMGLSPELAKEMSDYRESYNLTPVEKGARQLSNAQKIFWTGVGAPAWVLKNAGVMQPLLIAFNSDGLSGLHPRMIGYTVREILRTPGTKEFAHKLQMENTASENAFSTRMMDKTAADDLARRGDLWAFTKGTVKNPIRTIKDIGSALNAAAALVPNAQRRAVAYSHYKRGLKMGMDETQAVRYGAEASGRVLGDFDNVTKFAQNLEPIIIYTGATQAGTRAVIRSFRTRPAESAAKTAVMAMSMAGLVMYSMASMGLLGEGDDEASESENKEKTPNYFEELRNSAKDWVLENNIPIVFPWVKQKEDGSWEGVLLLPVVPDFRPLWQATLRGVESTIKGEFGADDAAYIAYAGFRQLTGDITSQLYDPKQGENNPAAGVLPSSVPAEVIKTGLNVSSYDGSQLEHSYDSTSQSAINASEAVGGFYSPAQIDQTFNSMGIVGDMLQEPGKAGTVFKDSFTKPYIGPSTKTAKQYSDSQYFERVNEVKNYLKAIGDEKTLKLYESEKSKSTESQAADLLKSPKRISQYYSISDGKFKTTRFWDAMKLEDALARQDGQPGNPLFDLKDDQLKSVLVYRSQKMLKEGKQVYDRDGNHLYAALGLDDKWYEAFRDKETAYYDKIRDNVKVLMEQAVGEEKEKLKETYKKLTSEDAKSFSGAKKPELTEEQKTIYDYYNTLPRGTGERSAFLDAHPWIIDYWDASDGFAKKERAVIGLKNWDALENGDWVSGSGGYGGDAGSSRRSGRSGGSSRSNRVLNTRQYVVGLNAGGKGFSTPTISQQKTTVKSKKYTPKKAKPLPKVSVKKSKV